MNHHFAKLFYMPDDRQLLVTKGEDQEGEPALCIRGVTKESHHDLELKITFKGRTPRKKLQARDIAFENITLTKARELFQSAPGEGM